ncbi:conserved hypothetical protein [Ricinus communis]|uniref:Uncharacterized protein n=1 Tax=Ricinus communis TaxID=3988 RepID=B9RHN1_RICCO|nr:conserved hypothetical protein [Ricinus communis]
MSKPKPPPKAVIKAPTASKVVRRLGRIKQKSAFSSTSTDPLSLSDSSSNRNGNESSSSSSQEISLSPSVGDVSDGGHHYESINDADDAEVETGGAVPPRIPRALMLLLLFIFPEVIALVPEYANPLSSLDFGFLTRASLDQSSISSFHFCKSAKVNLQHLLSLNLMSLNEA